MTRFLSQRLLWIIVLILGVAIGYAGGLEQMLLGRSIYLVHEAIESDIAPQREVRQGLDAAYGVTTVSMYLGIAVGMVAIVGLSLRRKTD